jgi:hypothetical protein
MLDVNWKDCNNPEKIRCCTRVICIYLTSLSPRVRFIHKLAFSALTSDLIYAFPFVSWNVFDFLSCRMEVERIAQDFSLSHICEADIVFRSFLFEPRPIRLEFIWYPFVCD